MAITTHLEVVNRIKDLAQSHKMVTDVRYGFLNDVQDLPDFDPPTVYIIPQSISVPRDGIWAMTFGIIAMDKLLTDGSNFDDVVSDCTGILMDMYSALLYGNTIPQSWAVQTGTQIIPFHERFTEYMGGATMTITINIFQENCLDNLPFD